MNNSNITLMLNELKYFTPKLEGWSQYVFTGATTLIGIVAFIVQRAVYRTIKGLGYRHINQIIIPSLVSKYFFLFYVPEGWPDGWPEGWPRRLAPKAGPEGWPRRLA